MVFHNKDREPEENKVGLRSSAEIEKSISEGEALLQKAKSDKEAIKLDILITTGAGKLFSLHERRIIFAAMDEYAASLLKENETFKDAMVERNDRCNELAKELEYWKQRCGEKDKEIERLRGLIEAAYHRGWSNSRVQMVTSDWGKLAPYTWEQFKSENNL